MIGRIKGLRRSSPTKRDARSRHFRLGVGLYVGLALLFTALAFKPQLTSAISDGETVTAEFDNSYKLRPYESSIKLAGIEVGKVTDVETTDRGTVIVKMKIEQDSLDKFGSEPIARIEPRTILGGRNAIEITPGGDGEFAGAIPMDHTGRAVELDSVLEALPQTARESLQGVVGSAAPTLQKSRKPLGDVLATVPTVLPEAGRVIESLRGNRPDADLAPLVSDLEATAHTLTKEDGQLERIADDLYDASAVLDKHRGAVDTTLRDLPETLRTTRRGISTLDTTFSTLGDTAEKLQPSVPGVVGLVDDLEPTLSQVEPLLRDLHPLLRDARPAVRELVPTARSSRQVLGDLDGAVLDRLKGPVVNFVMTPWKGTGPFEGGGAGYLADHTFYEEAAYMATNIDRGSMAQDSRGSTLAFQVGAGLDSIDGLPFDMKSIVELALAQVGLGGDPAALRKALRVAGVSR